MGAPPHLLAQKTPQQVFTESSSLSGLGSEQICQSETSLQHRRHLLSSFFFFLMACSKSQICECLCTDFTTVSNSIQLNRVIHSQAEHVCSMFARSDSAEAGCCAIQGWQFHPLGSGVLLWNDFILYRLRFVFHVSPQYMRYQYIPELHTSSLDNV